MKEQLISFETAKLAKKRGVKGITDIFYLSSTLNEERLCRKYDNVPLPNQAYECPTQSLLQKWLREKHNIDVSVTPYGEIDAETINKLYTARIANWNKKWSVHDGTGLVMPEHYHTYDYNKYEEAFEKGLQVALKLIT